MSFFFFHASLLHGKIIKSDARIIKKMIYLVNSWLPMLALESQAHCLPFLLKPGKKYIKVFQAARNLHTGIVTGNPDEKRCLGLNISPPWALLGKLKTSLHQGDDYKITHRKGRTVWLTYALHEPSGPDIIGHFFPQTAMGRGLKWAIFFPSPC